MSFKLLAEAALTQEQYDAIMGSGVDLGGLPMIQGHDKSEQWKKDSSRMELLVACQFPTAQVMTVIFFFNPNVL